jgi:hypothetical protein
MTYDEFLGKYLDHIEGRVDADARLGNRPMTAEDNNTDPNNPAGMASNKASALDNKTN